MHTIIEKYSTTAIEAMIVSSKVISPNVDMPKKYTCDGINVSPALDISFIPQESVSLAIIMEDPDAPINTWIHWLIWNLPVSHHIAEGIDKGNCGMNDFSKNSYSGPCPMQGRHQYIIKVYALDTLLELPPAARKVDLIKKMSGHILGYGELKTRYSR
jgi:Raf kinase inhibitor-like YbhB/YbcL family protein